MERRSYRWDVFISHASEDKPIALTVARWLQDRGGLRVWLDQSELRIGDSLRRSIDDGLARSKFGIVILSPAFFSRHWPKEELAGLATRETSGGKVILPIWYGVTAEEVSEHSPMLADKLALIWDGDQSSMHHLFRAMGVAAGLSPFVRLAGTWTGKTGRLRLRETGCAYSGRRFYEGEYDWSGYEWAGYLHGQFVPRFQAFLFRWRWDRGAESGIGYLEFSEDMKEAEGGWKTSEVPNAGESEEYSDQKAEEMLQQLVDGSTLWSFSKEQGETLYGFDGRPLLL